MKNLSFKNRFNCLLLFVLIVLPNATFADDNKNAQLESSLSAMSKIFSGSSVSRQVLHSNNEASIQYYRFSKSLYDDAVFSYKNGDLEKADKFIHASKRALLDAIEFANFQNVAKKNDKNHYESMRKSAVALMSALIRVGTEKGEVKQTTAILDEVNALMDEADKSYFEEQYKEGIRILGLALNKIKPAIRNLRTGETLVKSLNFADAKDEYQYELDRSNTHFMLMNMALKDLSDGAKDNKIMLEAVKKARKYRDEAEQLAGIYKYDEAIKKLEKSTSKIIEEIRNAGVYIPN